MANFESDITQFINQLKKDHPSLEQDQREGRARLWDRKIDADQQDEFRAARVPQKPYVYQTE
ncbi:DUF3460 family protein [Achromobacter sp. GG226]|uniref:DUF3460 family protein n=1 Tax=Verticiella alkaliphila TaxID=2779529 RepID=UPI001C0DDCAD|nr:DUF3460 family protein [Verticiella sp. GG226]MBU4612903.1 DUF3460 family protein [Verticiella sp. GG226]